MSESRHLSRIQARLTCEVGHHQAQAIMAETLGGKFQRRIVQEAAVAMLDASMPRNEAAPALMARFHFSRATAYRVLGKALETVSKRAEVIGYENLICTERQIYRVLAKMRHHA